jgi:cytochrome c oxidase cbb3-type subunit 3
MSAKREVDDVTGAETTGHEWDGIKELNKPLPRWWLLTFYACILWSIGYWVVYPAWPTANGFTKGMWGYSQRATVASEVALAKDAQGSMRKLLETTPLADVGKNDELLRFAMAAGGAAFQTNCAPCHGRGAQGAIGYPNLNDDDWIWGGSIDDIYKTIAHGVRADDPATRLSQMPKFGVDKLLDDRQIEDATEAVLALAGEKHDATAAARGAKLFADQCASCHGPAGTGKIEQGAPNLTDKIWLWGSSREQIVESIRTGRGGVMPAWAPRLDAATLKSLAVYVYSRGGGK